MNRPQINVTPLIDVLLVLLIIFMVVSPLKPSHFETRIPQKSVNNGADPHPWTLVVDIGNDESFELNNRPYGSFEELPKLTSDLADVFRERQASLRKGADPEIGEIPTTVFVKAPKSMSYGLVVKVIDAIKLGGASPLSLQIDDLGD